MPHVIETTVYTFDELPTESAKERARDWFREGIESEELTNYDDWEAIAAILGIEFKTRPVNLYGGGVRYEPAIGWSGFSSQGDGAHWEGSYSYAKGAPKRIREHAPQDATLHRIADELQAIQRRNGYRLSATVTHNGPYQHSGWMSALVSKDAATELDGLDHDRVARLMRDFADWIYRQIESQWEYLTSAESIAESIRANGYTFTESGKREG
jgi:hypothetical protein